MQKEVFKNRVRELKLSGLSASEIASKLNEEGIKTSAGKRPNLRSVAYTLSTFPPGWERQNPGINISNRPSFSNLVKEILVDEKLEDRQRISMLRSYFNINQ